MFGRQSGASVFGRLSLTPTCPDVIHFRNLAWRAPKYHCIIERYARLLKPGGIMVITELELTFVGRRQGEVRTKVLNLVSPAETSIRDWGGMSVFLAQGGRVGILGRGRSMA